MRVFVLLFGIIFAGFLFSPVKGQFYNYEKLLGKKNPYVSVVKGDSVFSYQRTDSSLLLLDKIQTQQKILLDLRVINKNQTTLEIWLAVSILLNIVCLVFLGIIFYRIKKQR